MTPSRPPSTAAEVAGSLVHRAATAPEVNAIVVDEVSTLTFGEWEGRANAVARGLRRRGVGAGHRVALLFDNAHFDGLAVAWAAVAKLGATAVPLGPGWQGFDLARVLRSAGVVGIVVAAGGELVEEPAWTATLEELESGRSRESLPAPKEADAAPASLCYRFAVMAPPVPFVPAAPDHDLWAPAADGGLVHAFPVGSPASQSSLERALGGSSPTMVVSAADPDLLCAQVARHRPAMVGMTPALAIAAVEVGAPGRHDLSSLRGVVLAGGVASPDLLERLGPVFAPAEVSHAEAAPADPTPVDGRSAPPAGLPLALTSQAGIVWRELLAPGSGNDSPLVYRLVGPLRTAALESALNEIVRRHSALRTRFEMVNGCAVQVVDPPRGRPLDIDDMTTAGAVEKLATVTTAVADATAAPVDLVTGPLFSPRLIRLEPTEHVLVVSVHHAVWDDWSFGIFSRELGLLYGAFAQGRPSPLPEPPAQFGDYVHWQAGLLAGDAGVTQRRYWEGQLAGAPLAMNLPIEDPDLPVGTPHASVLPVHRALPADLVAQLRVLAQRHRATLFMVTLAAFAAVVSRASGQDDLLLPTGAANRSRREHEDVIGCFLKAVPLRLDLSADPSFGQLIERVRGVVLEGLEHQDLPYDDVLTDLLGPRAAVHGLVPHPVVMFQSLNAPMQPLRLDNLEVHPVDRTELAGERANFLARPGSGPGRPWGSGLYRGTMLVVSLEEDGARASLIGEGGFHPPAVERLFADCHALLDEAVADPERPLSAVWTSLSIDRSAEASRRPSPDQAGSVFAAFTARARRHPERIAVVAGGDRITYEDLEKRAAASAVVLTAAGAGHGRTVEVGGTGLEVVVAVLGAWALGAAVAVGPSADVAVPGDAAWVTGGRGPAGGMVLGSAELLVARAELSRALDMDMNMNMDGPEQSAVALSDDPNHPGFLRQLLLGLLGGHCLMLGRSPGVDAGATVEALAAGTVDVVDATPGEMASLLRAGLAPALARRRKAAPVVVVACDGPVGPDVWEPLRNMQDARPHVLYAPPGVALAATTMATAGRSPRPVVGRTLPHLDVSVVDIEGRQRPMGAIGRVRFSGKGRVTGGGGGLATDQLGRMLAGGIVELEADVATMVDVGGFGVVPTRIADVLACHPEVDQVTVRPTSGPDPQLVGHVVPRDPLVPPTLAELRRHLWTHLPGYAWPAALVVGTSPDLGGAPCEPGDGDGGPEDAVGIGETLLAAAWGQVRGRPPIGVPGSYWASFSFVEALAHARQSGLEVTNRQVAQNRDLRSLDIARRTMSPVDPGPGSEVWISRRARLLDDLVYWRTYLRGAAAVDLVTDHPGGSVGPPAVGVHHLALVGPAREALRAFAADRGTATPVVLTAALVTLLGRRTGSTDVVVAVDGLVADEAPLRTLPLRCDLDGDPSFDLVVQRAALAVAEGRRHTGVGLSRMLDDIVGELGRGLFPLTRIVLRWCGDAGGPDHPRTAQPDPEVSPDLELAVSSNPDGLDIVIRYAVALYEPETAMRLGQELLTLVAGAVDDPSAAVSGLELIGPAERAELLREWNDTAVSFPGGATIPHQLAEQFAAYPAAFAVVEGDHHLTYGELDARANDLAGHLRDLGVGPETIVGICVGRSLHLAIALLATLRAGGVCMPLDLSYPPERLAFMLDDARPPVLVTTEALAAKVPAADGAAIIRVDSLRPTVPPRDGPAIDPRLSPDNAAYLIYTSGSTGRPKGAVVPHRGLCNEIVASARLYGLNRRDRVLQFSSPSFDSSIEEIFATWLVGATLVLCPDDVPLLGRGWSGFLAGAGITVLDLPTAHWHQWAADLAATGARVPPLLRVLVVGGEKASAPGLRQWTEVGGESVRWFNTYGPTEASIVATAYEAEPGRLPTREIPIGRPLANVRVYVLDSDGRPVPVGVAGELHLAGAGLARGYLDRPDLTAEKFVPDPFCDQPGARMYRSGDLARWSAHGELEYLGRMDRQVKVRGFRVELGEVEVALAGHPAVGEVLIVVRPGPDGIPRLVAYVVPLPGQAPAVAELRAHVAGRLPVWMVPGTIVVLAGFPLTPNGKVDVTALPAGDAAPAEVERPYVAPTTPTELELAELWGDVLAVGSVGVDDDFFALGGHSLLAAQVLARLHERVGVELPVRAIFEAPTVARLATVVDERRAGMLR